MTRGAPVRTVDGTTHGNRRTVMAKASSATADKVVNLPMAEDRSSELDGYTVDFVTITVTHDLAAALATMPDGRCPCPHWGYVFEGRLVVRYADGSQDVIEAGDAFFMRPGHVPAADAGTRFVQFSPAEELAAVHAAMAASMQRG